LTQRFQYKVLRVLGKRPESLEAELNKLGLDGWMVVYGGETIIILRRGFEAASQQLAPPAGISAKEAVKVTEDARE